VTKFIYLGPTVTNRNLINEEKKGKLNLDNACHHLVQNFLISRVLSKSKNQNIYNYNSA
jgi:hypothetical protein